MVINVQWFVQRCDVFSNRFKRRSGTNRATGYAPSPGCRRMSDLLAHASAAAYPTSASLFAHRSRPRRGASENAILHSVRHRSQAWSQTTPESGHGSPTLPDILEFRSKTVVHGLILVEVREYARRMVRDGSVSVGTAYLRDRGMDPVWTKGCNVRVSATVIPPSSRPTAVSRGLPPTAVR